MTTENGAVMYLNSGDWVENLTALEYNNGEWSVFSHKEHKFPDKSHDKEDETEFAGKNELFNNLLKEISQLTSVTS